MVGALPGRQLTQDGLAAYESGGSSAVAWK